MVTTLNIAKDFSRSPAGRFITDGPFSGEAFRENLLRPALANNAKVEVDLNGSLGFGSSFLEEAFGGLVRKCGFTAIDLGQRLIIRSDLKTYKDRVWRYIDEAKPAK